MMSEVTDVALGGLRLSLQFGIALLLPIVVPLVLLMFFGWAFNGLVYLAWPSLGSLFALIGAPLHELFHALGSLLTLCGIQVLKLLNDEVSTAFVIPSRSYFLEKLASDLGPLLGGAAVLLLTALYVIPGFPAPMASPPVMDLDSVRTIGALLEAAVRYVSWFFQMGYHSLRALQWANWRTYAGLYIAFSMGIGLALSAPDLKDLRRGLVMSFLVSWAAFVGVYLWGDAQRLFATLQKWLTPVQLGLSTAILYAFTLTLLGVVIFLPIALVKRWRAG